MVTVSAKGKMCQQTKYLCLGGAVKITQHFILINVLVTALSLINLAEEINANLLKGHCHDNFAIFEPKLRKCSTKNRFANMKLLLEHQEENIK